MKINQIHITFIIFIVSMVSVNALVFDDAGIVPINGGQFNLDPQNGGIITNDQFNAPQLLSEGILGQSSLIEVIPNTYIIEFNEDPTSINRGINQNSKINNIHSDFKNKIKNRLNKDIIDISSNRRIPGLENAIRSPGQIYIRKEFKKAINALVIEMDPLDIQAIQDLPEIKSISPDYVVRADLRESIPLIRADQVWVQTDGNGNSLTGHGITIGIIDTGVDYTHPALGGCTITNNINDGSCSKVIGGYDYVNGDTNPIDDHGHGTHVASTAAGNYDGYSSGVAPDAKIYAYKVLSAGGSGSTSNIIAAIENAMDPNEDGDFSDHLDIISLSLGRSSGTPDSSDAIAIDNAAAVGVLATISAGNSGPGSQTIGCPGCARKAITVAASNKRSFAVQHSIENVKS